MTDKKRPNSMKEFPDKFFDLCRESQQEVIQKKKMAEVVRDYAERLDN